eukprot:Opistho-1_new@32043
MLERLCFDQLGLLVPLDEVHEEVPQHDGGLHVADRVLLGRLRDNVDHVLHRVVLGTKDVLERPLELALDVGDLLLSVEVDEARKSLVLKVLLKHLRLLLVGREKLEEAAVHARLAEGAANIVERRSRKPNLKHLSDELERDAIALQVVRNEAGKHAGRRKAKRDGARGCAGKPRGLLGRERAEELENLGQILLVRLLEVLVAADELVQQLRVPAQVVTVGVLRRKHAHGRARRPFLKVATRCEDAARDKHVEEDLGIAAVVELVSRRIQKLAGRLEVTVGLHQARYNRVAEGRSIILLLLIALARANALPCKGRLGLLLTHTTQSAYRGESGQCHARRTPMYSALI